MGSYSEETPQRLCNIVTPIGMLGYGLDQDQLDRGVEYCVATGAPTAIILDSGSTDGGPNNLALGTMTTSRQNYKRDLRKILSSSHRFQVPVLISSAGGDGSNEHVEVMANICQEIATEPENVSYNLKAITIFAEISKGLVSERLAGGDITSCGSGVPSMSQTDINDCPRILAQMGPEPFLQAMEDRPDFNLVIGGRAYDPAPYVAFATFCFRRIFGISQEACTSEILGSFMHMGKIMECGGLCARPKSAGAMATLYQDGTYDIRPLNPQSKCTTLSVAAHTLYEKSRPDLLYGPGGYLDVTKSRYEQLADGRTVRVRGDLFRTSEMQGLPYQVKLEGARVLGYRSMYFGSLRDPILISQLDDFLVRVKAYVSQQHDGVQENWQLKFHTYDGRNKDAPSKTDVIPGEVFLIGEVLAETQSLATALADTARIATVHGPYPGQKATSGNFAFGICGTKTVELGPCAEFNIYHLMNLKPGEELAFKEGSGNGLFRWQFQKIGHGDRQETKEHMSAVGARPGQQLNGAKPKTSGQERQRVTSHRLIPSGILTLGDVASVIRSKNAGPFEITFDVMFESQELYTAVKDCGVLNQTLIEKLYNLSPEEVVWCGWFDQARAFKATLRRRKSQPTASGGFGETDVHGSQQYILLFQITFPEDVSEKLRVLLEV
ncbi:hypothetical protein PV04_04367 [Phialophora macrospora]|uniref:Uncharacterized protein n=1 Tax=Phialophora macrospora TaxID=1851006 RepID=A0A0D2G943_9EURO|nr:hypothetical protein PV04_04367 [Phialophora macrospora]